MTVVIGIICKDGVVIACDSQVEFQRGAPVKRLNANKIYKLDGNIAIAGAGMIAFIEKAIDSIRAQYEALKKKGETSISTLINGTEEIGGAEQVMASIYKTYDIERVKFLYGSKEAQEIVEVFLMIGGIEKINNIIKKRIYLLHKEGFGEPVNDYATIGSGAAYAEYLLGKYYNPEISVDIGKKLAIYVIKEVEKMDPNVGGPVRAVAIDKNGYCELKENEILKFYEEVRKGDEVISKLSSNLLTGKVKIEDLKRFL